MHETFNAFWHSSHCQERIIFQIRHLRYEGSNSACAMLSEKEINVNLDSGVHIIATSVSNLKKKPI